MKILKHGIKYSEDVELTCPICDCVFSIENANDWKEIRRIKVEESFGDFNKYEYICECPECENKQYFNIRLQPIFSREDWKERYSIVAQNNKGE